MSLEYHDLPDAQTGALLKSPSPLADVFADWENKETGHIVTTLVRPVAAVWQAVRTTDFVFGWFQRMFDPAAESQGGRSTG